MKNLSKYISITALVFSVLSIQTVIASGGVTLKSANINVSDKSSLQRGAKLFTDNCLSCHSAKFVRFNRVGEDLGLTEKQVMENLNHLGVKYGATMSISMTDEYAKETFGAIPPDLSLVGRSRGADWLYTYLTGFYEDKSKTTGFNNTAFKDVGMPNVLWELQGIQKATFDDHGAVTHLEVSKPGTDTPEEFNAKVRDLVNFLAYISEPRQVERKILGYWVLAFLSILLIFAYVLKKEYWKDVH